MRPFILGFTLLCGLPARASTPLFEDDLKANKRVAIDAPASNFESDLDKLVGGSAGFSTEPLKEIDNKIRSSLYRERLRSSAHLILFLYPGKVTRERLKAMPEIGIDVDVDIDPCDRAVCREAVARHIEVIGGAIGRPVLAGAGFSIRFRSLEVRGHSDVRGEAPDVTSVSIEQAISASARSGGGLALLDARRKAEDEFQPRMAHAITEAAGRARVQMASPPKVNRTLNPLAAQVNLVVRGDRAREKEQVLAAFLAAARVLSKNPATPADTTVDVAIKVPMRRVEIHRYRAPLAPLVECVNGTMEKSSLFGNYIAEVRKDAQEMNFSDADAHGE